LNAKGRSIILTSAIDGDIHLGSGVKITADPPMPSDLVHVSYSPLLRADLPSTSTSNGSSSTEVSRNASLAPAGSSFVLTRNASPESFVNNASTASFAGGSAGLSPSSQNAIQSTLQLSPDKVKMLRGGVSIKSHPVKGEGFKAVAQTLSTGSTLVSADHAMTIETPFGQVKLAAGSVVLTVLNKDGLAIYNVHDAHRDDVHVIVDGHSMPVPISHHLMITSGKSYEDVNPIENITHRDMKSDALKGGLNVFRSQFSISSAISGVSALHDMLHSADPTERKMINRLVKDAAVLMQTSAVYGAYKRYSSNKPSLVAVQ
jgi:hypothetical protein